MPRYKITATDDNFGGRQTIHLRIRGDESSAGIPRTFTRRVTDGDRSIGEDRLTVEAEMTPEQAEGLRHNRYEVEEMSDDAPRASGTRVGNIRKTKKAQTPNRSTDDSSTADTDSTAAPTAAPTTTSTTASTTPTPTTTTNPTHEED